jgi:DNA-binding response OmpR family regulator
MLRKVLVIDDDRGLQSLLNVLLTRAGFDVEFADDGRAGLEKINGGNHYAVIMLDLLLPEISGLEILEQLRKDSPGTLARTIVLTSASQGVLRRVDASSIHALVRKPFDIQEMIRVTEACAGSK